MILGAVSQCLSDLLSFLWPPSHFSLNLQLVFLDTKGPLCQKESMAFSCRNTWWGWRRWHTERKTAERRKKRWLNTPAMKSKVLAASLSILLGKDVKFPRQEGRLMTPPPPGAALNPSRAPSLLLPRSQGSVALHLHAMLIAVNNGPMRHKKKKKKGRSQKNNGCKLHQPNIHTWHRKNNSKGKNEGKAQWWAWAAS